MICEKCGAYVPENRKKCPSCRGELPQSSACGGFRDISDFLNKKTRNGYESQPVNNISYVYNREDEENMEKTVKLMKRFMWVCFFMCIAAVVCSVIISLLCSKPSGRTEARLSEIEDALENIQSIIGADTYSENTVENLNESEKVKDEQTETDNNRNGASDAAEEDNGDASAKDNKNVDDLGKIFSESLSGITDKHKNSGIKGVNELNTQVTDFSNNMRDGNYQNAVGIFGDIVNGYYNVLEEGAEYPVKHQEKQEENAKDDVSNALFEKNGGNAGVKPEQNTNSGVQSGNGAVSDGN